MYPSQTYARLSQSAVANDLKAVLKKNKGGEAAVRDQMLVISQGNQKVISIKMYQPVPQFRSTISETRR